MSATQSKFTVTRCAAGVENQKSASALSSPKSTTSPNSRGVLKLRERVAQNKLMLSRQDVKEENDDKREAFLAKSHVASSMLYVQRKDQAIGVKMLVQESWRYQQTLLSAKQKATALRYKMTEKSLAELMGDVSALMGAKWKPLSTGAAATTENHPYLYTANQIHRLKLFL